MQAKHHDTPAQLINATKLKLQQVPLQTQAYPESNAMPIHKSLLPEDLTDLPLERASLKYAHQQMDLEGRLAL